MYSSRVAVLCAILELAHSLEDLSFPPGFKFGTASASYQVEGAWNVSDKAESIWDRFTHTRPEAISDRSSGDVACDSYHLWERDLEMLEELGVHFYRFSISWPRLLPTGFSDKISVYGANYYSDLIDGLLERGIEPVVTLFHWDLPQRLQDLGGWTNPLVADWFAEYARVCYSLFGDRVRTWLTINEPVVVCDLAYNTGAFAPGLEDPDVAPYLCSKNVLLAHAKAYRAYDEFRENYDGQISIVNNFVWMEAASPQHQDLAELANLNVIGRYSHAIYSSEGGWPPVLEEAFKSEAKEQGLQRSKLPEFTQEEIENIRGTYDFYALNYYTSRVVRAASPDEELGPWPLVDLPDFHAKLGVNASWEATNSPELYIYPEGLRHSLAWLQQQYGDVPILITENGYSNGGGLEDPDRSRFYRIHLEQILLSIKEDGVNVTGYTVWSLMDDFEWASGYSESLGLYQVDFSSPLRTRTPRASAAFYAQVIQQHSLNVTTN